MAKKEKLLGNWGNQKQKKKNGGKKHSRHSWEPTDPGAQTFRLELYFYTRSMGAAIFFLERYALVAVTTTDTPDNISSRLGIIMRGEICFFRTLVFFILLLLPPSHWVV